MRYETGLTDYACSERWRRGGDDPAPPLHPRRRATGCWWSSQSYNPGWSARVDGIDVPVIPVDGLVRGIPVPNGRHEVEIHYVPARFDLSLQLVSVLLLTCVALAVPPLLARVRKQQK